MSVPANQAGTLLSTHPPSVKATCHSGGSSATAGPEAPVVALVGAPNTGKSTLFNALTGARVTMGNWPGTTVEVSRGVWRSDGPPCACCGEARCTCEGCACYSGRIDITLVDLPGAYSLEPESPDEALTRELLLEGPADERPDVCVLLADASRLSQSLFLASQVREHPTRMVIALTMVDVAGKQDIALDLDALSRTAGVPVVGIDPRRRSGLDDLSAAVREALRRPVPTPREPVTFEEDEWALDNDRFNWVAAAVAEATVDPGRSGATRSDRIDRWLTAPVIGPIIFLAVMWVVFQITTVVAAPLQDGLDTLVAGPVSEGASALLAMVGLGETWVEGLLVDGLIAGVGALLTFVPLMALMFVLLALLEDSGYMARAAVVTDRVMRAIGLPGRAFIPLIVGYGCNVPAVSATRVLPVAGQRILTALLVPFTACTARLAVFVMVGVAFFGPNAGTVVFAMYLASVLVIILSGLVLRHTIWRDQPIEPLVIDLPPYQVPTLRLTASVAWVRLKGFLQTATGIIVVTVAAVWLLQATPVRGEGSFADTPVADSAYGVAAQAITPVFGPTGFAKWETTSALVVGFVAKEAVISSWAQTYALDEPEEGEAGALGDRIVADFTDSSGGHPIPAALAFLVFMMSYTACMATVATQWREIGPKWTLFGVVMQLAVAWTLAVAVFQIGRLFV
ncbi:MAG: ferrous iron transport protein B [Propionicimonas sp.]